MHLLKSTVCSNKGATKWPRPLQTERALKQRTHTPLRLSQTSPRTSAMLHVMQVLLGCFPIKPKRKKLKSPEHNTEATATHQNPRCGGGAQAFSINGCFYFVGCPQLVCGGGPRKGFPWGQDRIGQDRIRRALRNKREPNGVSGHLLVEVTLSTSTAQAQCLFKVT